MLWVAIWSGRKIVIDLSNVVLAKMKIWTQAMDKDHYFACLQMSPIGTGPKFH